MTILLILIGLGLFASNVTGVVIAGLFALGIIMAGLTSIATALRGNRTESD